MFSFHRHRLVEPLGYIPHDGNWISRDTSFAATRLVKRGVQTRNPSMDRDDRMREAEARRDD